MLCRQHCCNVIPSNIKIYMYIILLASVLRFSPCVSVCLHVFASVCVCVCMCVCVCVCMRTCGCGWVGAGVEGNITVIILLQFSIHAGINPSYYTSWGLCLMLSKTYCTGIGLGPLG